MHYVRNEGYMVDTAAGFPLPTNQQYNTAFLMENKKRVTYRWVRGCESRLP